MKQHKWHKEIKAWAEGKKIEAKWLSDENEEWQYVETPIWDATHWEYRIKPQPKEQDSFKAMCEIPYKHWVLRFYQMPNDLWYSEGMDDAWMKEMVEASKPQPKEPKCKTHPDAPHGFCRDASHSEDRYVCECEFWEEPKEPQYLYVHFTDEGKYILSEEMFNEFDGTYIGKIKLEVEDD